MSVSSPESPVIVLPRAFPSSVSAHAVPTTFSIPVALESVTTSPDTIVWAVVTARSTITPPLASPVKSRLSESALAPSVIVTEADSVPRNT